MFAHRICASICSVNKLLFFFLLLVPYAFFFSPTGDFRLLCKFQRSSMRQFAHTHPHAHQHPGNPSARKRLIYTYKLLSWASLHGRIATATPNFLYNFRTKVPESSRLCLRYTTSAQKREVPTATSLEPKRYCLIVESRNAPGLTGEGGGVEPEEAAAYTSTRSSPPARL